MAGHKSVLETLNTYAHLWPDSDDQTRRAVDAALLGLPASAERGKAAKSHDQRDAAEGQK